MNDVKLYGTLARDAMFAIVGEGKAKCMFTVMTVKKMKEKDFTSYVPCVAWGDSAKLLEQYGKKGVQVLIEGSIGQRSYDDKNGNKVYTTEVNADRVNIIIGTGSVSPTHETPRQEPVKAPQKPKVDTSAILNDEFLLPDPDQPF